MGASSTGGGASGRGQERTDIAKAKFKAATHMAAGLNSSPNKGMQGKARVAMVGLVITIAQRKGGAGKTTLATQLAVAWACAVAHGLRHLISIRKAVSQLGSICAGRGLGQRRSVLILPHCLAGARRNGSTIGSVRRIWS